MLKQTKIWLLVFLLLVVSLTLPLTALAQGPITPEHTDPTWTASYWPNRTLAGAPVLVRQEENINYNWGTGSPAPAIPDDNFSARWEKYIDTTAGTYRFIVTSDDGVRLWIDGELVLNEWNDHAEETFYVDHYLSSGHHLVRMEYYERTGFAIARLTWLRSQQAVGDWQAAYYNNMSLSGAPALTRNTITIDYDWGTGSPAPEFVRSDNFSARWTRTANFPAANYTFMLTVDDGARLWVNGHLLIDAWFDQAATMYTEDIFLSGSTTLELQYYENTGFASVQLDWEPPLAPEPPVTAIIVDDQDPGFTRGGASGDWGVANEGYNNRLLWTRNNDRVRANYNWGRWYPNLTAGEYEVYVYVPFRYTTTAEARYWVAHAQGLSLQIVDQSAVGGDGDWVSLGRFTFQGDGTEYVSLADVTFEPYQSTLIAFDAVRWVPR